MDASDLDRMEQLFQAALLHPPEERRAFIDAACADDPELRSELRSLLEADRRAEGQDFLDEAPHGLLHDDGVPPGGPGPPGGRRNVGPYVLLRRLGHGGMGAVYLASRERPFKQMVALKIVREGMGDPETLQRFEMERQILASLNHPNVARLLDGGMTAGGLPYFAMEYVEGLPITAYCDRHRLNLAQRLELFHTVCQAVHYAHQNLILHRDLKPSNIQVTKHGQVKLLDFGIAKLLNPALSPIDLPVTRMNLRLMTPEYASPEQVRGEALTTSSDVYSLGVILYELLTGHRPYSLAHCAPHEAAQVVCEHKPQLPSSVIHQVDQRDETTAITPDSVGKDRSESAERLRRQLRGDLDNIVMMALRKEASRRYGSAELLGQDVAHSLSGAPVTAYGDSRAYRFGKFIRRHRVESVAAMLVFLALVVGLAASLWQKERTRLARDQAADALEQAEHALQQSEEVTAFLMSLFEASDPRRALGLDITARDLLEQGVARTEELAGQPLVQAQLLSVIGRVYFSMGAYGEAAPHLKAALGLRRAALADKHPEVARALNDLALVLRAQRKFEEARTMLQQALGQRRALLEEDHLDVAESLHNLGLLAWDLHELAEAESLFTAALDIRRKRLGADHLEVASSLLQMGHARIEDRDFEAAEAYIGEALAIQRRKLSAQDPRISITLQGLARLMAFSGDQEASQRLLLEALEINRQVYGDEHPSIASLLERIGLGYQYLGNLDASEAALREAVAMSTTLHGEADFRTVNASSNLSKTLHLQGKLDEALALSRTVMAEGRRQLGPRHPQYLGFREDYAALLRDTGDYAAAEPILLDVLAFRERQREEAPPGREDVYERMTGVTKGNLVSLYDAWGRPEQAARFDDQ